LTYHSATLLTPGRVLHAGKGVTYLGELDGALSPRLEALRQALAAAGFEVQVTQQVRDQIYAKLALNACTLPTSALLGLQAHQLVEHPEMLSLMRALLTEVVAVARAEGIALDETERWEAITGLLRRAVGAKSSMLQDVERKRRTEIDVINGAIVEAGRRAGIATPYNDSMVWLIKGREASWPI
jgi:2-dehydropantoate 2-reductase